MKKIDTLKGTKIPVNWRDERLNAYNDIGGNVCIQWELDPREYKKYSMPLVDFIETIIKAEDKDE